MSYGVDQILMYRRAADYVAKIFKGAKATDLAVEQATKFELVIEMYSSPTEIEAALGPTMLLAEHGRGR